ncbi:MAG: NACHT domain-containing protein [Candidatus Odinarchaeota archaeon]
MTTISDDAACNDTSLPPLEYGRALLVKKKWQAIKGHLSMFENRLNVLWMVTEIIFFIVPAIVIYASTDLEDSEKLEFIITLAIIIFLVLNILILVLWQFVWKMFITRRYLPENIIDFTPYIENLANCKVVRDMKLKKIYSYYISLEGQEWPKGDPFGPLDKYCLEKWLLDPDHLALLVLGTTGTGKSILAEYLAFEMAREWLRTSGKTRIPVLINLRDMRSGNKMSALITNLLQTEWGLSSAEANWRNFWNMHEAGKLCLILDGFDESLKRVTYGDLQQNLAEIATLVKPGGKMKVWLSTRPEAFLSDEELFISFYPEVRTYGNVDTYPFASSKKEIYYQRKWAEQILYRHGKFEYRSKPVYGCVEFSDVSPELVQQYLARRYGQEKGINIWEKFKNIYQLMELSKRIVLLNMIARTVDELGSDQDVTLRLLYSYYVNQWIDRDISKGTSIIKVPEQKKALVSAVAWQWLQSKNLTTTFDDLEEISRKLASALEVDVSEMNYIAEDLVLRSFLMNAPERREYTFNHKSFAEYFVAEDIAGKYGSEEEDQARHRFWELDNATRQAVLEFSSRELFEIVIRDTAPLVNGEDGVKRDWLQAWVQLHDLDPDCSATLPRVEIMSTIYPDRWFIRYEKEKLVELDLDGCNISQFAPSLLKELKNVQNLYISNNKFDMLPEWFKELKELRTLALSGNLFTSLPEWFGELNKLESLQLSANRFTDLPECLVELKELQWMTISVNQLTKLPEWFKGFKKIYGLTLNHNKIIDLPDCLRELKQLELLDLDGNRLMDLPDWLGELKNLQMLDLGRNQLTALPERLGELKQLYELHLERNQLTALPERLGELKQLGVLILSNNQLTSLPKSIKELNQLQVLDLSGNEELGHNAKKWSGDRLKAFLGSLGSGK